MSKPKALYVGARHSLCRAPTLCVGAQRYLSLSVSTLGTLSVGARRSLCRLSALCVGPRPSVLWPSALCALVSGRGSVCCPVGAWALCRTPALSGPALVLWGPKLSVSGRQSLCPAVSGPGPLPTSPDALCGPALSVSRSLWSSPNAVSGRALYRPLYQASCRAGHPLCRGPSLCVEPGLPGALWGSVGAL